LAGKKKDKKGKKGK